ncbi:MAG: hypothetical protein ACT4TC_05185 [Myxococcaceae bacterium]
MTVIQGPAPVRIPSYACNDTSLGSFQPSKLARFRDLDGTMHVTGELGNGMIGSIEAKTNSAEKSVILRERSKLSDFDGGRELSATEVKDLTCALERYVEQNPGDPNKPGYELLISALKRSETPSGKVGCFEESCFTTTSSPRSIEEDFVVSRTQAALADGSARFLSRAKVDDLMNQLEASPDAIRSFPAGKDPSTGQDVTAYLFGRHIYAKSGIGTWFEIPRQ